MSLKIINPGYVSLLANVNAKQTTEPLYSNTGVSFFSASNTSGIHVPYFESSTCYLKFDLYIPPVPNSNQNFYVVLPYITRNYLFDCSLNFSNSTVYWYITEDNNSHNGNVQPALSSLKYGSINTFYFTCSVRFSSAAHFSLIINNVSQLFYFSTLKKTKSSSNPDLLSIYCKYDSSDYPKYYISNIIFSDSPIDYSEKAIAVPISEVYTDMSSLSSNLYVANSADQSLLASLDINSLLNDVSVNSKVTGIMVAGEPVYTTGVGEVSVISKVNDSVTEKGTIALSENSLQSAFVGWDTDITLNDLSNTQLGFKVG